MSDLTEVTRMACKGLLDAMYYGIETECDWTEELDDEPVKETNDGPRCPKCGGPIGYYQAGV